jgi:hypothetical protein
VGGQGRGESGAINSNASSQLVMLAVGTTMGPAVELQLRELVSLSAVTRRREHHGKVIIPVLEKIFCFASGSVVASMCWVIESGTRAQMHLRIVH